MITPFRRGGRSRAVAPLILSLGLVTAACGGDDAGGAAETTATTGVPESTPAPPDTTDPDTTDPDTTEAPETTAAPETTQVDDGPNAAGFPLTIENCGVEVTVEAPPERAVTMNQAATEVMLSLGLEDHMVGTAYMDDEILPELAATYESVPVLAESYPSIEVLFEAEPDFVYGSYASAFREEAAGERADLQDLGIGTYLSIGGCPDFRESGELLTFDHVFGEIADIAAVFGVPERADDLTAEQQALVDAADVSGLGDLTVMWWDGQLDSPSVGSCCGAPGMLMHALGVINLFETEEGSWATVSWEQVVSDDPDVIILVDADWSLAADKEAHLRGDPALQDLSAVVNDRMVTIPFSATTPGVRNAPALAELADAIRALDLDS